MDYLADVQIVARRVLSPELYKLFREVYFENYGNDADSLSLAVRLKIQKRCSTGWRLAKVIPFASYWHHPTPEKLGVALDLLECVDEEQRLLANKIRRKTLRKARGKAERRTKHATLAASA